ncbi:c-type cytochrome [Mariniphaga sp.]|uniref:c-type cytochrome n=1 Tax=Mariniphaga sp. TaxID=1954475 RepID=UPI003561A9DA
MILTVLNQIPVPKDIPLPMPLPEWLLVIILVFSFLLHILFINLMIGGSVLTFWYELKGQKNKDYDNLAREIAATITVNKSLAVVLGVAPLLSINVLYTLYFYSSNALTGNIWISVVPWVAVSFLLLYLHKYSWDRLADNKPVHLGILGIGVFSFLLIPFIFLTNINLMLFPEKWGEIKGFFDALTLPNVFPRYFHFITASMAITGLFLAFWFGRRGFTTEGKFETLLKSEIKKQMVNLVLVATGSQFIFGPLLFLTLPGKGVTWGLFWVILAGATIAAIILYQLWKMISEASNIPGKRFYWVLGLFTFLVAFMGTGRHMYRESALSTHKEMMAERTAAHWEAVRQAHENLLLPQVESEAGSFTPGQDIFQTNCAICHAPATRLIGPAMAEAAPVYTNDIEALKQWIKEPGRKRMDYPPMAGFPHFTEKQLTDVANYVLQTDWE